MRVHIISTWSMDFVICSNYNPYCGSNYTRIVIANSSRAVHRTMPKPCFDLQSLTALYTLCLSVYAVVAAVMVVVLLMHLTFDIEKSILHICTVCALHMKREKKKKKYGKS